MSKYVLNRDTALVLNGKVYALVREEEVTNNSVCLRCPLNDVCIDYEDNHHLSALCMPEEGDSRWFFVNAEQLTKFQQSDLEYNISGIIDNL